MAPLALAVLSSAADLGPLRLLLLRPARS